MTAARIADFIPPDLKLVSRAVATALTLARIDGFKAAVALSQVIAKRCTDIEAEVLAWAALKVIGPRRAQYVVGTLYEPDEPFGAPLPPLFDVVDDASWWARHAAVEERRVFAMAAFRALTPEDQADFLAVARRLATRRAAA